MPLYKIINHNLTTQILIWEITETFEDLFDEVVLKDMNLIRLHNMKSQMHQRGFLSVRKLLQQIGLNDFDLLYDTTGKPYLKNGKNISITHSFEFSALIISDEKAGIDIEKQRSKIMHIADKFLDYEFSYLSKQNQVEYIQKLTVIWGAKEAVFKIRNEKGISFKNHIKVTPFELINKRGRVWLHIEDVIEDFTIFFEEIQSSNEEPKENFTVVYAFEN